MVVKTLEKSPVDVLNYCTKYLSRGAKFFNDQVIPNALNLYETCESWRFPIVLPALDDDGQANAVNEVTFIYQRKPDGSNPDIEVFGSFAPLYTTFKLLPVVFDNKETGFYYVTLILPVGKGFYYRFRVNGIEEMDSINPQIMELENKKYWSFFFTDFYNYTVEFEEWEINILQRLTKQILPFRTQDAQNYINRFYLNLSKDEKYATPIYKLDESVGEVNFITNILARKERQHLLDYKICIDQIDRVLRQRNPFVDSWNVSEELIIDLYNEMANDNVPGWDTSRYQSPKYFLSILRRHAITGAFSHPKYGGNIGGVAWNFLKERYPIKNDSAQVIGNYFNWDLAMENPLGANHDYKG